MIESLTFFFDANNRIKISKKSFNHYDVYFEAIEKGHKIGEFSWYDQTKTMFIFVNEHPEDPENYVSLEFLEHAQQTDALKKALTVIEPFLIKIAYNKLKENAYIYRFRTIKERNAGIYINEAESIYQSQLCSSIKAIRRVKEKVSNEPVLLDFGTVQYILPSHFGFCLGVQNAIERAYETIANYPNKSIYMLSELIHNPFVNNDLNARGLKYLQTDKGEWLDGNGTICDKTSKSQALWNLLKPEDIVIIPAFGATHDDKLRLIKKGITLKDFDATCMLVEKVWKTIKEYAQNGFTTIIHGKYYHEETKATFSNAIAFGPALIISDLKEAEILGQIIQLPEPEKTDLFRKHFSDRCSQDFDPVRDLEKIAVVNQTTLLRNHTIAIIRYFKSVLSKRYGADHIQEHLWENAKGDTLCYATQVNQDALIKALDRSIDVALVVGGKNSSNTYQLYQLCAEKFKESAHYIQSEANILDRNTINHYVYSKSASVLKERPFLKQIEKPVRILITGGASCPDGIIQQVIYKINGLFPQSELRSMETVLEELNRQ